jgi:hypothetical protein
MQATMVLPGLARRLLRLYPLDRSILAPAA